VRRIRIMRKEGEKRKKGRWSGNEGGSKPTTGEKRRMGEESINGEQRERKR